MMLDSITLMAVGSFATLVSAFLVLGSWQQIRAPALPWWAAANLANSAAIGLLAYGIGNDNVVIAAIASGVSALSPALVWAGARRFNLRKQIWPALAAGTAIWIAAGVIPLPGAPGTGPIIASFGAWVVYLGAALAELWSGRAEPLAARWPLMGFIGLHAFIFLGGVFDTITTGPPVAFVPLFSSWFSLIHAETIIYAIATPIFMVLLCKERSEQVQINAARQDSLTGIANRGTFLENSERTLRRCQTEGRSFSLIMFDLDHFKWINDTFGHDVGDNILRVFADTTRNVLRPNDLFGRYGGEEFCVVLPGATIEAAFVIAERVRHKFAEAGQFVDGKTLNATTSAGVATAASATTLDVIIRNADQSMYRAKSLGRNRVERATTDASDGKTSVIRVA